MRERIPVIVDAMPAAFDTVFAVGIIVVITFPGSESSPLKMIANVWIFSFDACFLSVTSCAFAVSLLVSLPSQITINALREAVTLWSSATARLMPSTIEVPNFL